MQAFVVALVVTICVGIAVRMEPYFAGDIAVAHAVQTASPSTAWASTYTSTAIAPAKWFIAAAALVTCFWFGGWPGALLFIVALTIEQTGGEASKQLFMRPRPSPDLIRVVGRPSGYSFPSTFMTFHSVAIGSIWLLAWQARPSTARRLALALAPVLLVIALACRVTLGAHWPSDVVLTAVVCFTWLWALIRLGRSVFGR
jgi:membrane-associated phospholipid phosphatase